MCNFYGDRDIINKTVQIPMVGLNMESIVSFLFPHRPNTLQTGWVRAVCCSTETLLAVISYSKQFVAIIIMAARQLAGRRPLYFTADVSILFIFFRRLISGVSGPIVTKLCHMFDGGCNF